MQQGGRRHWDGHGTVARPPSPALALVAALTVTLLTPEYLVYADAISEDLLC